MGFISGLGIGHTTVYLRFEGVVVSGLGTRCMSDWLPGVLGNSREQGMDMGVQKEYDSHNSIMGIVLIQLSILLARC